MPGERRLERCQGVLTSDLLTYPGFVRSLVPRRKSGQAVLIKINGFNCAGKAGFKKEPGWFRRTHRFNCWNLIV